MPEQGPPLHLVLLLAETARTRVRMVREIMSFMVNKVITRVSAVCDRKNLSEKFWKVRIECVKWRQER